MSVRRTAVVVVNYGSSHLLAQNLVASVAPDDLVVVVDNWTDAAEREDVGALAAANGWFLESPVGNTGFGGGMNIGAARALAEGATALVLLNPDARFPREDRERLVNQVAADPTLLVAPRIVRTDGTPWMSGLMDLRLADGTVRSSRHRAPDEPVMEWVSGAVMALSAELWRRIGGFDDGYFLYWEDVDLCRRVHEAGGSIRVDQSATAVHDEGGTQPGAGGRAKSEAFYYYNIRNRALYAARWLPAAERRSWRRSTLRAAWATMLTGGRRQFLESPRPWRALARGVAAANRVAWSRSSTGVRGVEQQPSGTARIRVLESFAEPSDLTNPYITQLRDALASTPGVEVRCWSWREALLGGYDVFHAHWPEALIERRGRLNSALRQGLYAMFLGRLWLTRRPVVRTVHNVDLPEGLSSIQMRLLQATDALTRERVVLNPVTPVPEGASSTLVEHGHYRDWFQRYPEPETVPGRLAFTGKVRRYKNVEGLVRAFRQLGTDQSYSLQVAGKPSSPELADALRVAADADPRITLDLSFVPDQQLVEVVGEAELVVLPYREMHNSGSVLAVLSLSRPVLVPDNDFNRRLSEEVGPGWVLTFDGELTGTDLEQALATLRRGSRSSRPDLSGREWDEAGNRHRDAFCAALSRSRRRLPASARTRTEG